MLKRISILQAKDILDNNEASVLVDIRDSESYNQNHVSGALHLNQNNLSGFISDTAKDIPVLVMCYHGNSSQIAAQFLTEQGFKDVYSIDGGFEAWVE